MDEIKRIIESYDKRDLNRVDEHQYSFSHYRINTKRERENVYTKVINQYFSDISNIKIIEIGAGEGENLHFFRVLGFKDKNISANELRPKQAQQLKIIFPSSYIHEGNALDLNFKEEFDICFQSTVFSSILSDKLKEKIACRMFDMTKKNGIILWYDFIYDNPWNKDVKGVKKEEIKKLFPQSKKLTFYNIMLAPPIGRRVGPFYPLFNFLFPFLRSHVVAVIEK